MTGSARFPRTATVISTPGTNCSTTAQSLSRKAFFKADLICDFFFTIETPKAEPDSAGFTTKGIGTRISRIRSRSDISRFKACQGAVGIPFSSKISFAKAFCMARADDTAPDPG